MTLFTLDNDRVRLQVAERGGAIEGLWWQHQGKTLPLLRPGLNSGVAVESSCFPLVPFGNRVSGNQFSSPAGSIGWRQTSSGIATIFTAMAG